MNKTEFGKLMAILMSTYEWFSTSSVEKVQTWYELLKDIPYKLLSHTIMDWIKSESKPPTIADLRTRAIRIIGEFPTPEEAWVRVVYSEGELTDEIRKARKFIGGGWAIAHTSSPEIMRSQFIKAYEHEVENRINELNKPGELQKIDSVKLIGGKP